MSSGALPTFGMSMAGRSGEAPGAPAPPPGPVPALARGRSWALAAGLAALLFALAHFNLASALPLFVLALGLSLAYVASGSLWVPILMHALFNTFSLALLLLTL